MTLIKVAYLTVIGFQTSCDVSPNKNLIYNILFFHSWPAKTKLHRWFRGHWRSITLSTWTGGTSLWYRSSPRKEVRNKNHFTIKRTVKIAMREWKHSSLWRFVLFFCFQSCSYQTKPTSSMPCPQWQTLTLFCASPPKARRNHWEPRLASDDTQNSTSSLQILLIQLMGCSLEIFFVF